MNPQHHRRAVEWQLENNAEAAMNGPKWCESIAFRHAEASVSSHSAMFLARRVPIVLPWNAETGWNQRLVPPTAPIGTLSAIPTEVTTTIAISQ